MTVDEVDRMSAGDRGNAAVLNAMTRKSKVIADYVNVVNVIELTSRS